MLALINDQNIYEEFHKDSKLQKRIISRKNFTYRNLIEVIEKVLKNHPSKSVLDIGCGTGTMSFYLSTLGLSITGVDISEKAINTCVKNKERLYVGKKLSFFRINFPSEEIKGKFDLIICLEVLEHIKDEANAIKNIKSLLAPRGVVVFSVPSSKSLLYRFGLVKKYDQEVGHLRRYSVLDVKNKIQNAGLEIGDIIEEEGVFRNFLFFIVFPINTLLVKFANRFSTVSDFLTFIDNIFLRFFGGSQIIFVARKI